MATTTLTGSTGNNLLNAPGSVQSLVQGLAGNDTITLAKADDLAEGGKGNDTIGLTKTGAISVNAQGGAGADSITIRSSSLFNGVIMVGADNDLSTVLSTTPVISTASIALNEGNDTLRLNSAAADTVLETEIGLGKGNDTFQDTGAFADAVTSTFVFGGTGKDSISLGGANTGTNTTVQGGAGADRIFFTGANAMSSSYLMGGKGTDAISMVGTIGTVAGGGLADTITLGAALTRSSVVYGDALGVKTKGTGTGGAADGADVIANSALVMAAATIYGGGGADVIDVRNLSASSYIDAGNGQDSITLFSGGTANNNGTIFGGAGLDTIRLYSGQGAIALSSQALIDGGTQNDTYLVNFGGVSGNFGNITANGVSYANFSANAFAKVKAASGDTISFANTATANEANANWRLGNASVWVLTAARVTASAAFAPFLTALDNNAGDGSVMAYSDGTDTWIAYWNDSDSFQTVQIAGSDLVLTTRTDQEVALNSTNFGFTLGHFNTTSSSGLSITLN